MVFTQDERIDGQFYKLSLLKQYNISVKIFFQDSSCVLQRYVSPLSNSKTIDIRDNSTNYFYLPSHTSFTFNFKNNNIDRIIALSKKTSNIRVTVGSCELSNKNFYCKIEKGFKGSKYLMAENGDAFIELINVINNDYQILNRSFYNNYELQSKNSILVIPYTQKTIEIQIKSVKPFNFSFSNGFTNDQNYCYNSISNTNIEATKINDYYQNKIIFYDLYRNISLVTDEFFSFVINVEREKGQIIYLNYKQSSEIEELMEEILEESYCQNIIKSLKDLFEIYVFSDIARKPPEIDGFPNYHHEKINFQKSLSEISIKYRKFYEFYQEIEIILAFVKDRHLNIVAEKTPLLTQIGLYYSALPFDFIIKEHQSEYMIFIKKNFYFDYYNENVQNIIDNNVYYPVKRINRINPFDYIKNWSNLKS